jgi:hypothetical protein
MDYNLRGKKPKIMTHLSALGYYSFDAYDSGPQRHYM